MQEYLSDALTVTSEVGIDEKNSKNVDVDIKYPSAPTQNQQKPVIEILKERNTKVEYTTLFQKEKNDKIKDGPSKRLVIFKDFKDLDITSSVKVFSPKKINLYTLLKHNISEIAIIKSDSDTFNITLELAHHLSRITNLPLKYLDTYLQEDTDILVYTINNKFMEEDYTLDLEYPGSAVFQLV